jgi:hypothetical protein
MPRSWRPSHRAQIRLGVEAVITEAISLPTPGTLASKRFISLRAARNPESPNCPPDREGHSPSDAQAIFGRGEDPHRAGWCAAAQQSALEEGLLPPRAKCAHGAVTPKRPPSLLTEGGPRGREDQRSQAPALPRPGVQRTFRYCGKFSRIDISASLRSSVWKLISR